MVDLINWGGGSLRTVRVPASALNPGGVEIKWDPYDICIDKLRDTYFVALGYDPVDTWENAMRGVEEGGALDPLQLSSMISASGG